MNPWLRFAAVQLIMLLAAIAGVFVLIPFCLAQAWVADATSNKDGRVIDRWKWRIIDLAFGNPEDGASGRYAQIWLNGTVLASYMPNANPMWRAYLWSAWRNSCNALKYAFAVKGGPFVRKEWMLTVPAFSRSWPFVRLVKVPAYVQAGYYPDGAPVMSAGRR